MQLAIKGKLNCSQSDLNEEAESSLDKYRKMDRLQSGLMVIRSDENNASVIQGCVSSLF